MKEGGEKTGHANKATEGKAVEKTKPSGIRFPQNRCDCFPFGWFTAARAVLCQQSEENQYNDHRKHGQSERVRPTEFLSEARREERGNERARIPCGSNAHDETLILWRTPASLSRTRTGQMW